MTKQNCDWRWNPSGDSVPAWIALANGSTRLASRFRDSALHWL